MADFWVSAQRHWCKYCKKYIANNKPSLDIHNNGRTHKENVERFLREVYKDGRQKKEDELEKLKELERIEKAAIQSFHSKGDARSLSSLPASTVYSAHKSKSIYTTSSSAASASTSHIPPPPTLAELQAANATPEILEGKDEWAIPAAIAQPGAWKTVSREPKRVAATDENNKKSGAAGDVPSEFLDDEEDQEDIRHFKIREKEYPADSIHTDNDDSNDKDGEVSNTAVFKKRKVGQQSGKRRIRQKSSIDD
ncbi:hypothetical protein BX666DRAFT_74592 [Dichotomocladium elegans]|nr:hypothetical protein BX666DRAFT_74592 [Dichotomocladium elegans]